MRRDLMRRVAKLEVQLGLSEQRLRRLAERIHADAERLLQACQGHESQLANQVGQDGTITWEGYLLVLKLLGIDPTRKSTASGGTNNAKITQNNATNNASLTRRKRTRRPGD